MKIVLCFIVLALIIGGWLLLVRPRYLSAPPLSLANDDPLIIESVSKARSSIAQLRQLFAERPHDTTVKVPFKSDAGVVEYLWGELRSLSDDQMEVFLLTPPATQSGEVERLRKVPLSELQDWQVELSDGSIRGGYSMQVMFIRAREQWGEIPKDLAEQEKRYKDF